MLWQTGHTVFPETDGEPLTDNPLHNDEGIQRLADELDLNLELVGFDNPQELIDNQYNGGTEPYEENK